MRKFSDCISLFRFRFVSRCKGERNGTQKAKWSGDASGLNEKTLSLLFDYQRFEHEPELEALLDEAENEYCAELSDDDLAQVSAAGEAKRIKRRGTDEDGAV